MIRQEIRHFHVCSGSGGGAMGFNRGQARVGIATAVPRCIGGVDVDPAGIEDFDRVAGARGTVIDLFTREQYEAFHSRLPPAGWREAVPDDFRRAAGGERPHVVFMSTPCKGFSGLLSDKISGTARYQALNGLTLRAVWLTLEAWKDNPPEFLLFENVPRIATRGRWLLDQIEALLAAYGYVFAETTHDCGELGGLGQSRKRFLLVARHAVKVPPFLYEPPKRRLRGVGEILGKLPLPGDLSAGPMHRVPSLQWKTWVRLAFVEAGADWRSLNRLRVDGGQLADYGIAPEAGWHAGVLGVQRWEDTSGTVTGRSAPTNGTFAVADPRPGYGHTFAQLGVLGWDETSGVVTGQKSPGQGTLSVADPRLHGKPRFNNVYRIVPWGEPSAAVAGPGGPGGGLAVADPRAEAGFGGAGKYRVTGYAEPAGTVIGASTTGQGAFALADPRPGYGAGTHQNILHVAPYDGPTKTVTGARHVAGGALCVADPRPPRASEDLHGKHHVTPWDAPSRAVIGGRENGASVVADPRPNFARGGRDVYQTGGHYGVTAWDDSSGAVTGSGQHDNGRWSVADPRLDAATESPEPVSESLPAADDRLVAMIRALDGTWHRPFTTYELAALQSYVDPEDPKPLVMAGTSDSAWRERIGNMVPAASAEAIMGVIARTLLLAWAGETFMLSSERIWVREVAIAASIDLPIFAAE